MEGGGKTSGKGLNYNIFHEDGDTFRRYAAEPERMEQYIMAGRPFPSKMDALLMHHAHVMLAINNSKKSSSPASIGEFSPPPLVLRFIAA